jgi:hypothetical protein
MYMNMIFFNLFFLEEALKNISNVNVLNNSIVDSAVSSVDY